MNSKIQTIFFVETSLIRLNQNLINFEIDMSLYVDIVHKTKIDFLNIMLHFENVLILSQYLKNAWKWHVCDGNFG